MSHSDTTGICFEHDRTRLASTSAPEVVVPVGAAAMAAALFRHHPPTPGELERAIDRVEDALASTRLVHAERGDLRTEEPRVLELLGLREADARVSRDQVELLFQHLASIASGRPAGPGASVPDAEIAALLLILRECMHHLGFAGVRRGQGPA